MSFRFLLCYFVSQIILLPLVGQTSLIHPDLTEQFERQTSVEAMLVFAEQRRFYPEQTLHLEQKSAKANFVFQQLQEQANKDQRKVITYLDQTGIDYKRLIIVNAISATLTAEQAQELASYTGLKKIILNPWVQQDLGWEERNPSSPRAAIEWGVEQINAPALWNLGFTGQGVVVGGQDTGYEFLHPSLINKYRGLVGNDTLHDYNWHDAIHSISPLNNDDNNPCGLDVPYPCDDNNHGTHTMGTMIGDDGQGNQIGVAPGASWVACRNMERGWGSPASYLECFEWFLAPTRIDGSEPDPSQSPDVIANSWSCPEQEGCSPDTYELFDIAINNLRAAGVVVVASAGNDGSDCETISKPPSVFLGAFSVGATNVVDTIAGFSSRGPSSYNGEVYLQPQVVAPGVNVRSAVRNGGYSNFSGTSMAGPHVAGAVAVLISALPDLKGNVLGIEQIFRQSALPLYSAQDCGDYAGDKHPNAVYGYGRIDLLMAYELGQQLVNTETVSDVNNQFRIFPNPATDVLNVLPLGNAIAQRYTLTDLSGRVVFERLANTVSNGQLSLSRLPAGVYVLNIQSDEDQVMLKFVKH